MKNKAFYVSVFFLTLSFISLSKDVYILVHGTWASEEALNVKFIRYVKSKIYSQEPIWYKPGGNFHDALLAAIKEKDFDSELIVFSWSGNIDDRSRYKAGIKLAELIQQYESVTIIAHSHGSTVGIIAADIIAEDSKFDTETENYKIKKFYSLGVPVNKYKHFPNMNVIKYFYNLFSFEDMVQPVFGIYGRTFYVHERVANISVSIDKTEPGHSEIHHALMAKALLAIHENISCYFCSFEKCSCEDSERFSFLHPGKITIDNDGNVFFKIDHDREALIARDKKLMWLLTNAFMRNKKK
jgi:hypothetical protein